MMYVCLVNGSLRGPKASSLAFLDDLESRMLRDGLKVGRVQVPSMRRGYPPTDSFRAMALADALILAFPLFAYCLSGGLTRFLEDFLSHLEEDGKRTRNARLYAIVNCGFPDASITMEARRVIRNFCARAGFEYRFSVSFGCGPATVMTGKIPILNARVRRAYESILADIRDAPGCAIPDILVQPVIPKWILIRVKESYERRSGTL